MRKSLFLLVLLAACTPADDGGIAATVNGVDIAVTEVQAMRVGAEATTINKRLFATDLTDAIIDAAIVGAVSDEFAIEPSEDEVATKVSDLTEQIESSQGVSIEEFFNAQGLSADRLLVIARQQVIRDKLIVEFSADADPVSDEEDTLPANPDHLGGTTACVSHILLGTENEANAALDRIEGGETFAAVAGEVGTDGTASTGGELGCGRLDQYVPAFAQAAYEAPIGELVGPVETDFGFHVIVVKSRYDARVPDLVSAWIVEQVNAAEVEVDPQFGNWVLEPTPMVQAPAS